MNQRFKARIHDCGGLRILVAASSIRQRAFLTSPRAEALPKKGPQIQAGQVRCGH